MKHFRQEEWVDFARGVADSAREKAMRKHLQECSKCAKDEKLWRAVSRTANQEDKYSVPVPAVRIARSVYGVGFEAGPASLVDRIAQLVWDSWQQPLPAGVRSHAASAMPRQVLYRAGDYMIDLRVDRKSAAGSRSVVGQVMNASKMGHNVSRIPIVLEDGVQSTAAMTNDYGEFHVEFKGGSQVRLSVGLHQGGEVSISLDALESEPN